MTWHNAALVRATRRRDWPAVIRLAREIIALAERLAGERTEESDE